MFLTLAAGFGAMWIFNWVREDGYSLESRMIGITAGAVLSILAMMFAESGFCVIPVVLIGFFFHGKKLWISLLFDCYLPQYLLLTVSPTLLPAPLTGNLVFYGKL